MEWMQTKTKKRRLLKRDSWDLQREKVAKVDDDLLVIYADLEKMYKTMLQSAIQTTTLDDMVPANRPFTADYINHYKTKG